MTVTINQHYKCIILGCKRETINKICHEHRLDICHRDNSIVLCEKCGKLIVIEKRSKSKYKFDICNVCNEKEVESSIKQNNLIDIEDFDCDSEDEISFE